MTVIYIQEGDAIDYFATAAVPAGSVVVQGQLVGVSSRPIPAGTVGGLLVEGVFDFPLAAGTATGTATGTAANTGTPVFWNPTTTLAGLDATVPGVIYCGVTIQPLANNDSAIRVLLNHPR